MALLRDPDVLIPEIHPLLQDRWSPRAFDESHVLDAVTLATLLEAARWSPSAGNSQPWGFIVGLRGDATFEAFRTTHSRGNTAWTHRASALLVTLRQLESGPDHEIPFNGYTAYDLGQAAAHLSIQAQALGLHAHQFAGFDHDAAKELFEVPDHWAVTTGIAIGRLADPSVLDESTREKELRPRTRRPASDFSFAGKWGEPLELQP
ncbi:MAG: nitroreductase family protein [Solirubrobacteraceae bacterium]|nr:nitroreductase family protein [Solirubrobacteraceae bacterium]